MSMYKFSSTFHSKIQKWTEILPFPVLPILFSFPLQAKQSK